MTNIITAKIQHLEELITISRQSFYEAYEKDANLSDLNKYIKKAFDEKELEKQLLDDQNIFFLFERDEKLVAYAKLRWDRPHSHFSTSKNIELERIYVLKAYWGKQIGSILLKHSIEYAIKNEFKWMWLLVWFENKKAISFYKRWGFEFFATKAFVFGDQIVDDWLFKRKLVKE